jgi:hypothetical protein
VTRASCLILAVASCLRAQSFDQYAATENFTGKPAAPIFKTAADRAFRTAIREAAAKGPNFAGHYTIAEWGCGAGCVSIAMVDAKTGTIHRGPFRILAWTMMRYEGKYNANDDKFQQLEYRPDSRLLIARGCPEETNCASYFWEWTGAQFRLIRKIAAAPLP